jgi:hypothetical protein
MPKNVVQRTMLRPQITSDLPPKTTILPWVNRQYPCKQATSTTQKEKS